MSAHQSHDPKYAWVYGHGIDCSWESSDCTQPWCFEILVRVDVLTAAAAQPAPDTPADAPAAQVPGAPLSTPGQMARGHDGHRPR
ncbi:hypothetical protein [Micromonospora craterilacus]|uniref:hypothetical protein n=1 Tax=Micromonospora craterilacus TaxID=1655439 RepID=UPI0011B77ADE|nr:hypothetical protein [Micromonospora craterilacus]